MEGWGAPSRAESTCRGISNLCALDLWFVFFVRSVPYLFRFLVVRYCMRGRSHWACSAGFQQAWSSLEFSTWRIMFLSRQLRLFEHERERGDGDSAGSTLVWNASGMPTCFVGMDSNYSPTCPAPGGLHRMVHASLNLPRICLFVCVFGGKGQVN